MHVIRKWCISSCWKTLSRQIVGSRIESRVSLHSNCIKQRRTKLEVKPFWKINAVLNNVSVTFCCNVDDEFFVNVLETQRPNGLNVDYDYHSQVANMTFDGDVQSELAVSLPFQVDFDVVLKGTGNATIGGVENESVQVDAESYDINLEDVKSNAINIVSNKGDILCAKTLKGNINLESRDGNVVTKKVQGHDVSISCETGHARVGDIYAEELRINTGKGIEARSIHGRSQLHSNGGVTVGTAEGDLFVTSHKGDVNLHLADHARNVDLTAERGNVEISFSSNMNGEINVDSSAVDDSDSGLIQIPDGLKGNNSKYRCGDGSGTTVVTAKAPGGTTFLRRRTWLEAISAFGRESNKPL